MIGLNFHATGRPDEQRNDANDVHQEESDGTLFTLMTDGLLVLLFFAKMSTGLLYLIRTARPPSMDYDCLEDLGRLKWHTRRIKKQRIDFKNYVLVANVTSTFILLQTTLLLFVLWNEANKAFFRYAFLILVSLLQLTLIPTINDHLAELDQQVTYRIERHASFYKKHQEGLYEPPVNGAE